MQASSQTDRPNPILNITSPQMLALISYLARHTEQRPTVVELSDRLNFTRTTTLNRMVEGLENGLLAEERTDGIGHYFLTSLGMEAAKLIENRGSGDGSLNPLAILRYVADAKSRIISEVAQQFGLSQRRSSDQLEALLGKGWLSRKAVEINKSKSKVNHYKVTAKGRTQLQCNPPHHSPSP